MFKCKELKICRTLKVAYKSGYGGIANHLCALRVQWETPLSPNSPESFMYIPLLLASVTVVLYLMVGQWLEILSDRR